MKKWSELQTIGAAIRKDEEGVAKEFSVKNVQIFRREWSQRIRTKEHGITNFCKYDSLPTCTVITLLILPLTVAVMWMIKVS